MGHSGLLKDAAPRFRLVSGGNTQSGPIFMNATAACLASRRWQSHAALFDLPL